MRTRRPARPAAPRPAARGQCAGAAADASVYVRARRWRRRGKQREESDERRGSLKRAAMALRNPQLPPYNGTVLCGTQAPDELPDGQEYQRIEFGVNEVIEPNDTLPRTPNYSISSTLNPQAPEFILSCTTSKKIPDDIDKEAAYSSVDCQYPGSALALDGSSSVEVEVLENDGVAGGLGQRERKKKKKRPPGYYSYLKDGGEGSIPTDALVNGHANPAVPNSVGPEDVELAGAAPPLGTPRTCGSPQGSTDFVSDAVSGGPFPGALDGDARTAGQPGSCHGADLEQSCLPAEAGGDGLSRTAVAQPSPGTHTTENLAVANGQILESSGEGSAANGVELHTVESPDSDAAKAESAAPAADAPASAAGAAPASQPKSWASLFHDSKPSSSSPVASVETKYSPPATSPLVSEKQVEVKEGLVPVSEDPVAIKIAGIVQETQVESGDGSRAPALRVRTSEAVWADACPQQQALTCVLLGISREWPCLSRYLSRRKRISRHRLFCCWMILREGGKERCLTVVWSCLPTRRSVVYQQSSRESATLQPFFTLQLDIQSDKIRTVQDALESLVARESVQGYTTKTKQEVEISRRVTLEKLPPVLVLHLKRFVYEKTGGCQKLVKSVEYPVDLEISKELLSPGVKNKNFKCHRTYRLFAVVYHHGSSATGGHYTTDVFQIGLNGWLRIDDQTVKVVNQYQVVKPTAERTAYLLYYRRVDLL
uniref:ubiquitin carboxyl-terminal hydrolase 10 n=1 Tax=Panthera onca TaxID=9690 RepID=UPI002954E297|nr:ubiquitin carboxyl-terminal hydrolase 10 [Panthera onca]